MISVTVVIPVYKVEQYIERCVRSVVQQTYKGPIECILVDDCGGDKSIAIAERFINTYNGKIQFRIIYHNKNKGLSAARNTALKVARGDYITFLDSDDYLFTNSIEDMVAIAERYPDVDLVQGDMKCKVPVENKLLGISASYLPDYSDNHEQSSRLLLRLLPMTACGKLIRRNFILDNSLWFKDGLLHEDELWRIEMSRKIRTIAQCFAPIYYYDNDNTSSITHSVDMTKRYLAYLTIAENVLDNYSIYKSEMELYQVFSWLTYDRLLRLWPNISGKAEIKDKIAILSKKVKQLPLSKNYKDMLSRLNLPTWILQNRILRYPFFRFLYTCR